MTQELPLVIEKENLDTHKQDELAHWHNSFELIEVVEGKFYDAKAVQALAEIPSREELLGRLLGSIKSPVSNFARVLNQIAQKDGGEAA